MPKHAGVVKLPSYVIQYHVDGEGSTQGLCEDMSPFVSEIQEHFDLLENESENDVDMA